VANTTWKKHERRTAAALGGRRTGPTGKDGPDVVDAGGGWLVIECKERRRLPGYMTGALAKVRGQAGPGQLGLVVAHELGARSANDLVIMARADFQAWLGSNPGADAGQLGEDPDAGQDLETGREG
jgi:hypothetical protein